MGNAAEITSSSWEQEVLKDNGLVLVDFWAPWCGPCKAVAPVIEELALEYKDKAKITKLNTDDNPDIASKYRIMGIPTLMFFKGGQIVDQAVGALTKKQLKDKLDTLLK